MMKFVLILCFVGIAAGFSLNGQQYRENKNDRLAGRCVDVFGKATCLDFKEKGWCESMPVVEENCCLTCGDNEEEREVTDDEVLSLLRKYLDENEKLRN